MSLTSYALSQSDPYGYGVQTANTSSYIDMLSNNTRSMLEDFMNKQYSFNAEQAKEQRQWLKMMSDTQYQRAMEDMKKAGINPLVAFSSLEPAGVPSSSAASGSQTNVSSLISGLFTMLATNTKVMGQIVSSLIGAGAKIL